MIKLQNNFTTPEQSKWLLELGVPRRSADEYRDQKGYRHSLEGILDVELFFQNFPDYLPCWSVGRLIEIYLLLVDRNTLRKISIWNCTLIESIMEQFEDIRPAIEEGVFDFSKLEELC